MKYFSNYMHKNLCSHENVHKLVGSKVEIYTTGSLKTTYFFFFFLQITLYSVIDLGRKLNPLNLVIESLSTPVFTKEIVSSFSVGREIKTEK